MHGIRLIRALYGGHAEEIAEGNRRLHECISAASLIDGRLQRFRLCEVLHDGCEANGCHGWHDPGENT